MDLPLLEALINYKKENNVAFSMPGNKDGQAFKRDSKGKEFIESLGTLDITEVEPLDNLHQSFINAKKLSSWLMEVQEEFYLLCFLHLMKEMKF